MLQIRVDFNAQLELGNLPREPRVVLHLFSVVLGTLLPTTFPNVPETNLVAELDAYLRGGGGPAVRELVVEQGAALGPRLDAGVDPGVGLRALVAVALAPELASELADVDEGDGALVEGLLVPSGTRFAEDGRDGLRRSTCVTERRSQASRAGGPRTAATTSRS